ncbi:heme o synthase [Rhodothermus profundi]|uniref:Protoheme IX farnesyltransferase n=1 Tax=Rhodothermus profundi TaxID=633813 RepID=A0A1M6Q3V0_9BACT|nr:heme o synthase [Rhodothermus profundi]SHK14934.1 protoheme IX farnesyltransferase [Rhodothermus profundi]
MRDQTRSLPTVLSLSAERRVQLQACWELTKPEITFQVTLSALAGYLLGTPAALNGWHLLGTLTGIGLTAAGVGALNHYLERDYDAAMRRTARRPLPSKRISPATARYLGLFLVFAGIGLLCPVANALTAALAIATVLLYLYVYTPLKRRTKYNTLIGTIPGALPALGGWTAATGTLEPGGWTLFAILAVWQMPHFLSLAWMYRKDYERAHYQMLPVVEPDGRSTAWQTLGFTALLLPLGISPYLAGVAGLVYLVGAVLLGLYFLWPAWTFFRTRHVQDARRVLIASVVYIPALTGLIVLDWLLR